MAPSAVPFVSVGDREPSSSVADGSISAVARIAGSKLEFETMATSVVPVEQRVRLSGISWETYERLLSEHRGRKSPRFTYHRGELEIMVISFEHEESNRLLHDLFTVLAEEQGLDFVNAGSTTLKREDLEGGFEPDTAFYVAHAGLIRGKARLELPVDPPPDLVIEVDITNPSVDKMPIYHAMGVPEVWRYDGANLHFFVLAEGGYRSSEESLALSALTRSIASAFMKEARSKPRTAWMREIREWARKNLR